MFYSGDHFEEISISSREFEKFIRYAADIARELSEDLNTEADRQGEEYVMRMLDLAYSQSIINSSERDSCYSLDYDYEKIIYLLLEKFLDGDYLSDDTQVKENSKITINKLVAYQAYSTLGSILGKEIQSFQGVPNIVNPEENIKSISDQRPLSKKLENPIIDVLSILISQTHKTGTPEFHDDSETQLYDFLNILGEKGILSESEFIQALKTNDLDSTLYKIFKYKIFGIHIPYDNYLYECFLEFETAYKKRKIHSLTQSISEETLKKIESPHNERLLHALIEGIDIGLLGEKENNSEDFLLGEMTFDRDEIISLLQEDSLIDEDSSVFLRTIDSLEDFLNTVFILLDYIDYFSFYIEDELYLKLQNAILALKIIIETSSEENKNQLNIIDEKETISLNASQLIEWLLEGNIESLRHDYLDEFISLLEKYIPHKPFYMHILHIAFDELQEISSTFHKAIHILGILVCDILETSDPLFEDASELLLCNTRSEPNHAAIKNLISKKNI